MGGKALALLVPYAAWILLVMPFRGIPPEDRMARVVEALINPHAGFQMWYLAVLFYMFVIFALSRLVSRSDIWVAVVAAGFALALLVPLPEIFGLDKIAWLYPFLVLGYLARWHRKALRPYDLSLAAVGLAAFPLLLAFAGDSVGLRFAAGIAGILAAWGAYRLVPYDALEPQAWAGQRTLGIYGAQMIVLPFVMVGTGWLGFLVSEVTVTATSLAIAVVLGSWSVTRAVFLGQWPKRRRLLPAHDLPSA